MDSVRSITTRSTAKKWYSIAMLIALLTTFVSAAATPAAANTIGQGFVVTASDLAYILKQIKIAEFHAANTTSATGPCGALLGSGPNQIPSALLSFGLRTVDGSCNNLQSGQETFGAADQAFPRLTTPSFKPAEADPGVFGPPGGSSTSYAQTSGFVFDTQPRTISNLIVDQTSDNPAAIAAAGFPVRSQGNEGVVVCTIPPSVADPNGTPDGCVPEHQTLFIPNITTDVGLSPPFNGLFTIFGQFFDHGLDKITNGGSGTVVVPLNADDPLVTLGPDGIPGNGDEVPAGLRFMTLTRGTIVTGPDGFRNAPNTDTPFVDQSQTYTSHSSHQFFTREYALVAGKPTVTGKFLSSSDGGLPTWAMVKAQAATKLGMALRDVDVVNIPMIAADAYGNFIPGPNGMPQYVTTSGVVEGSLAAPVAPPANVRRIETAFLNDIAHSADPGTLTTPKTPDADNLTGGSLDPVAAGQYDNELLDIHFICGDGRCNENIALTAIHQIFHNEHDRLIDYYTNPTDGVLTRPENAALLADFQSVNLTPGPNKTFTYGERLFQAARFVTEMQYQHLVFEEFARKVQPAINPFEPFAFNQTDVNPAITAEFAHAVYRFGHSMLTETIDRIRPDGTHNDIPLLDGFLNPAAYTQNAPNGPSGVLTSRQAATQIFMGMSDQTGNEIDEFVTNTLRNNLLGLPLDLPAINMTRARSEGIPSLNNVRKQIYAQTNDGQLAPYENWVAFGQALKHPESLINFVAAYGKHPTLTAATTLAGKREAARLIVNPDLVGGDIPPADAADFMFSTGAWANSGSNSITGLDDVDLWVGGLAENTLVFGGLLGSTFNYVFEYQLTNLQNGDRFYYLARTPGMNLRTQLEGNSFAELVMRNTDAVNLKADPFATADCKFNLGSNPGIATPSGSTVTDDPLSECREDLLLIRQPNGQIRYRSINSIDPPGINGQSVYSGTLGIDRIFGGNDNDTFWGGPGNDIIDGAGGDDVVLGGEGNDIITDLGGFDTLKGGPGNDAIDGGVNDDLILAGEGVDFTNGGANLNEAFLGDGNDFAIAGQGTDAVFGDSGDDWEEGGDQPDLLIGDSSTLFFDDHNLPGHDILIGQGGDDDYDMEGGDDIGVAGPGVEKVAGASGWDWEIGLWDPQPQDADLALLVVGNPPLNETRDRYNEVEALSGWQFNDKLRGDDVIPSQVGGGGFIGCDALDQAGINRIAGLGAIMPPLTTPLASVVANSVTNYCLLQGPLVWGEGNILIGGAGSDILEGRGGDDILDGDRYLNLRLSIRANADGTGAEIGSTDLMEHAALSGSFGAGTTGMTLQQAVFAGLVDPGQIVAVRELLNPGPGADIDTAVFSGALAEYLITVNPNGSVTVDHQGGVDGVDTVWNAERLQFADQTVSINPLPAIASLSPATRAANGGAFTLTVNGTGFMNGSVVRWNGSNRTTTFVSSTQLTAAITAADVAAAGTANVTVFNPPIGGGTSNAVAFSITNPAPTITTLSPTTRTAGAGAFTLTVNGTNFVNGASVVNWDGAPRATTFVNSTRLTAAITAADVAVGGAHSVTVVTTGGGTSNAATFTVSATAPGAPTIGTATAGNASATVTWTAPASNGGSAITGYNVRVVNAATNAQIGALRPAGAAATSLVVTGLTNGTAVRFQVQAVNAVGGGTFSALSNSVTPAAPTVPGAPTIGTATAGNASATVTWTAPASNGGSAITSYNVRVVNAATNAQIGALQPAGAAATSLVVTGLTNGTAVRFQVQAVNAVGAGAFSALSNSVTPAAPGGATFTFGPVIDTYVDAATPNTVAGSSTQLLALGSPAGNVKQSFIRFTVSGLPVGAVVGTAKLRLFVLNGSVGAGGATVHKITNTTWNETTTTWNTGRPAIDGTQVATIGSTTANTFIEVTLAAGAITGNGTYQLAIQEPTTNADGLSFASRNNATVANRPQLIVTTN